MKRALLAILIVAAMVLGQGVGVAAVPPYGLQVMNQIVTPAGFEFDVYIVRTGDVALYLGNADLILQFNAVNFSNPTVVVDETQGLGAVYTNYSVAASIVGTQMNLIALNVAAPTPTTQTQFNTRVVNVTTVQPGLLVAHVTLTGLTNGSGSAGLMWRDVLPNATSIFSFDAVTPWNQTNVTDPTGHWAPDDQPLPVTLTSFAGSVNASKGGVVLEWKTASEVNNYGYTVQRKGENDADFTDLSGAFIAGKGTTLDPQQYSFVDKSIAKAGSYSYRLKQQDMDGTIHYTQSVIVQVTLTDVAEVAPKMFQLMQNYPNPFNPSTQVKFSVENTTRATMKVYNTLGEEVAMLFDGMAEAGRFYQATFNATGLASGVYFYRLTTQEKTDVRRMMLLR